MLGIDLTASNEWQGRRTFSGNCLHKIHAVRPSQIVNPYQKVINIIGKTLQPFTEEGMGEILKDPSNIIFLFENVSSLCLWLWR